MTNEVPNYLLPIEIKVLRFEMPRFPRCRSSHLLERFIKNLNRDLHLADMHIYHATLSMPGADVRYVMLDLLFDDSGGISKVVVQREEMYLEAISTALSEVESMFGRYRTPAESVVLNNVRDQLKSVDSNSFSVSFIE